MIGARAVACQRVAAEQQIPAPPMFTRQQPVCYDGSFDQAREGGRGG